MTDDSADEVESPVGAERMRGGVRRWVAGLGGAAGRGLHALTPPVILSFLTASALAPVAVPLLGLGTGAAAAAAIAVAGGMGGNYLADVLATTAQRMRAARKDPAEVGVDEWRDALAAELRTRLDARDDTAAALLREMSSLIGGIDGVRVAVDAQGAQVRAALAAGFVALAEEGEASRWILTATNTTAQQIQQAVAEQAAASRLHTLALERTVYELTALRMSLAPPSDDPVGAPVPGTPPPDQAACPYRGLEPFGVGDAAWFFGRERLTAVLVGKLAANAEPEGVVAVQGASGSGKSSLVRAGLVKALLRGDLPFPDSTRWPVRFMVPDANPVQRLAEQLTLLLGGSVDGLASALAERPAEVAARVRTALGDDEFAPRLLLVVDQAEELFTRCRDVATRAAFLAALAALTAAGDTARRSVLVVFAIRSDFVGRQGEHPELVRWLRDPVVVTAMSGADLRRAVEAPAALAGLTVEPELVDQLVNDLGAVGRGRSYPAGALPQLGYALLKTFEQREGTTLTVRGYQRAGRIGGAIAQAAEQAYARWEGHHVRQVLVRSLMTQLVELSDDTDAVRRRMRPAVLLETIRPDHRAEAADVLGELVRLRLLTGDGDSIEISHEALLSQWPRLRQWISEDRDAIVRHRQLGAAAVTWERTGRSPDALWRGSRLAEGTPLALTGLEREFLDAGKAAEGRRRVVRRCTVSALVLLLVVALVGGVIAIRQQGIAQEQAAQVAEQTRLGRSRQLASESALVFATDSRGGQLRALAAWATAPTVEARGAVINQQLNSYVGSLLGHNTDLRKVAVTADGTTAATLGADGSVVLWDVAGRKELRRFQAWEPSDDLYVTGLAFSGDGTRLAVGAIRGADGVQVWDTRSGERVLSVPAAVSQLAFHPTEPVLATGETDKSVHLRDAATGAELAVLPGHANFLSGAAFSADGSLLATGDSSGGVRLWDVPGRREVKVLGGHAGTVTAVTFSPDGSRLVSVGNDRAVRFWSVTTGTEVFRIDTGSELPSSAAWLPENTRVMIGLGTRLAFVDPLTYEESIITGLHTDAISSVAVSRTGGVQVSAGNDDVARVYTARNGRLNGHTGAVTCVSFGADGRSILTTGDATAREWDTATSAQTGSLPFPPNSPPACVAHSPDGRRIATTHGDGTVRLWDADTRTQLEAIRVEDGSATTVDFSADGRRVAVAVAVRADSAEHVRGDKPGVVVWDLDEAAARRIHDGTVAGLDFAPDNPSVLAFGTTENQVILFDVKAGKIISTLGRAMTKEEIGGVGVGVVSLSYNRDGSTLAVSSEDRKIRVWDLRSPGAEPRVIEYVTIPRDVAFSPDNTLLATGGSDLAVRLWRLDDLSLHAVLDRHANRVNGIEFSPDGTILATASEDRQVVLWRTSGEDAAQRICDAVDGPGFAEEWARLFPTLDPDPC